jgi:hypothetical protein
VVTAPAPLPVDVADEPVRAVEVKWKALPDSVQLFASMSEDRREPLGIAGSRLQCKNQLLS